ncbi:MAG: trehalose-6-phosphate synthase [Gammaproteobacteria bacterium]
MSRLIAVSNRVADPSTGKTAGGLAVGLLAALRKQGGVWFGWGGKTCKGEPSDPTVVRRGRVSYATVDIDETEFDDYYNGYSNGCLWPLCHYMLNFFQYERRFGVAYQRVNALFARKLRPMLREEDVIWAHDYHLIPLAGELRKAGVENPIGFFLHVPFPNIDVLRTLPGHRLILEMMTRYDVIGFQTSSDVRSFIEGLARVGFLEARLGYDRFRACGREFTAAAFPIGIDVPGVMQMAERSVKSATVKRTEQGLVGRDLIIGVDRLDYSKGLPQRFRAVGELLAKYPDTRGRLVFMQIAPPTRSGVRAYQEIREELEQLTGNINGRFAEPDWAPIRYLNRGFSRNMLMGMLRVARIGLVTPLRDGMNLVAKEFVAAQDPEDPGSLILSSLAGAAEELDAAVIVNPYDAEGVAEAIQRGANMPLGERQERYKSMLTQLQLNDISVWTERFLTALEAVRERATASPPA